MSSPASHDPPRPDSELERLADRYADGDESAIGEILHREGPGIERRMRQRIPPRMRRRFGVSDVVQDMAVELVQQRGRFLNRGASALRRFLRTVADRVLGRAIRRERQQRRDVARNVRTGEDNPVEHHPAALGRPSEQLADRERVVTVKACYARLSREERLVIELVEQDGLTYREVAERLAITPEAARKRFDRAMAHLVATLRDAGLLDDAAP